MRTNFGKRFIATGLIAAFGVNVMTATTALAGSGDDRGRDRSYGRDDGRGRDGGRVRGQERGGKSVGKRSAQPDARRGGDRGRRWNQPAHAGKQRHEGRGSKADTAHWHRPSRGTRHHAPVKIVRKPVVVKKTVVVKQPAPVHRKVVHKEVVYKAPVVKSGHRHGHGHGHYGPPATRVIAVPERRHYRSAWVVRDHGHRYRGYGHYHHDHDAYKWLAFTAITVALINNLTEYQQRAYEDAQIRATTAPVGETIHWNEAGAYGTVTTTREGTSSLNRYCREFQKTVTIGGRTEQAYGTACMQPDGAWEVVSDDGY